MILKTLCATLILLSSISYAEEPQLSIKTSERPGYALIEVQFADGTVARLLFKLKDANQAKLNAWLEARMKEHGQ